jgi:hypothetical protein
LLLVVTFLFFVVLVFFLLVLFQVSGSGFSSVIEKQWIKEEE